MLLIKAQKTSQLKEGSESLISGIKGSHVEELKEEIKGESRKVPKMNVQDNKSLETKIVEKKKELEALNQEKLNLEKKVVESKTTEEQKDKQIDPAGKEESPIVSELKTEVKSAGETERNEESAQDKPSRWDQLWQFLFSSGQNVKTEENSIEKPKNQEKVLKEGNVEKEKANGNEVKKEIVLQKSKGNGQIIEKLKPEESKKDEDEKQQKLTKNKIEKSSSTDSQKLTDQVKLSGDGKKVLKGGEKQKGTTKTDETNKNKEKDKNKKETEKVKTKDSEMIEEKGKQGKLKIPEKEEEKPKVNGKIVDTTIKHDETKHKLEEDLSKKVVTVKKEKVENQSNINKAVTASQKNGEGKKHKTKLGKCSYEDSEESVELTKVKGNFAEDVQT
uniref:Uncharacterized protein n=1 Tax=Meloidogyne enterolobii TaxID=390850 RepID=A0A6V7U643_MELEN|nr:unnamed protein product [Meloidogyne enterolobii]